jgi:hypothetical protein
MMAANELMVLFLTGGLTLFFLVTGICGLSRGRITVVNPHHSGAWPGILGVLLSMGRRHAGLQNDMAAHSHHVTVGGAAASGYAWLYIILGLACGATTLAYLLTLENGISGQLVVILEKITP